MNPHFFTAPLRFIYKGNLFTNKSGAQHGNKSGSAAGLRKGKKKQ